MKLDRQNSEPTQAANKFPLLSPTPRRRNRSESIKSAASFCLSIGQGNARERVQHQLNLVNKP